MHREDTLDDSTPLADTPLDSASTVVGDDEKQLRVKLGISFFLFGLINNILYVIILSAALDLVPPATPKGIIAFCNIAPALAAKVGWPFILKGRIRYGKRIIGCCACSVTGMLVVAGFDSLGMRLLGIALASFSSGLGELTFLQLSTTYPIALAGYSVGYFASGTGGAGVGGAAFWWEVRSLGVQRGVALSGFMPFVIPLTYYFLLPPPISFAGPTGSSAAYTAIPTADPVDNAEDDPINDDVEIPKPRTQIALTMADKIRLVRPLLSKYMLPLFSVYLLEYTINQGVSPTLIYPVPDPSKHWLWSRLIQSVRDYYPLWQLVYQSFVFLSRSSISIGLPALPIQLLTLPAITQFVILVTLCLESALGLFPENSGLTIFLVFCLISVEGICGGWAYVSVFYRVGQESHSGDTDDEYEVERKKQEREFKIGSIGFADSLGILLASLVAMPTEITLCNAQAARGKTICKTL